MNDRYKKMRKTILERYGDNFYKKIGSKGGQNSKLGGFASDKVGIDGLTGRERASVNGKKRLGKKRKDVSDER